LDHQRLQQFGRCPVGFGKVDVERDDCGPGVAQPVDELREKGARPWPLADLSEAVVVDVDDADWRLRLSLTWCRLLIEIEADQGSNTITGFVLDQNSYGATDNPVQQLAASTPLGGSTTNYAFNQPAVASSVASTITGASRTTQTLSGSFGGIMYPNIVGSALGSPYPVTGSATVSTDATSNRLAATLSGSDPLTSSSSGITNLVVNFGSLTGNNFARSTFINDNVFAAAENPTAASQINSTSLPTF
jgi:hypothetical protein